MTDKVNNVTRLLRMEIRSDGDFVAILILKRYGDPDLEFQWPIIDVPTIVGALLLCAAYEGVESHSKFVRRVDDAIHLTDYQHRPPFKFSPESAKELALLLTKSLLRKEQPIATEKSE